MNTKSTKKVPSLMIDTETPVSISIATSHFFMIITLVNIGPSFSQSCPAEVQSASVGLFSIQLLFHIMEFYISQIEYVFCTFLCVAYSAVGFDKLWRGDIPYCNSNTLNLNVAKTMIA